MMSFSNQKLKPRAIGFSTYRDVSIVSIGAIAKPSLYNASCIRFEPDQVTHKPGCTTTEDSQRLEISDLGSRGIVLSV